ncbi:MAG: MAPEG family protein [Bdellovibrionales bacterium]|nr:MAPEG family protein [Bdellovibrionales bacterium]
MTINSPILLPLVVMAAWSMVMWGWMYATRLPAIFSAKMRLDSNAPRGEQMNTLPPSVRWKADNYNNLMEQPTVFYAVALVLVGLIINTLRVVV